MKIAILGLGTVGSGVMNLLTQNREIIEERTNQTFEVSHVYGRSNRYQIDLTNIVHTDNIEDIIQSDVDIVIEVLGGIDFTYQTIKKLLLAGKHVVTANKDMLAIHVEELSRIANENQVQFNYEASVAGGIPVILGLQHGLNANRIHRFMGILNGTTNYILTRMTQDDWDFNQALEQAQQLGYAESDPTNDIGGFDAQRKTAILSRLAYRQEIDLEEVSVKGIEELQLKDIQIAQQLGYTMKLIGLSEMQDNRIEMLVGPMLIPSDSQLASVNEAMNAVFFNGDAIGETMCYGPGAGSMETASAIVADMMGIMNFGFIGNTETKESALTTSETFPRKYYVRLLATTEIKQMVENNQYDIVYSKDNDIAIQTPIMSLSELLDSVSTESIQALYPIID
ncbi:homoserine dehydrogenase [Aerococcaceae bacterium DSM 111020]|nr:homoserine dehydrogenase [Aerococcaceae bacterium DSM 111020]